jgi:lipoate-protein ligase A
MFSLLKVPNEKIRDKMISIAEDRVTSVEKELGAIGLKEVEEAMILAFERRFGVLKPSGLSKEEMGKAHALFKERYSTREWNSMR